MVINFNKRVKMLADSVGINHRNLIERVLDLNTFDNNSFNAKETEYLITLAIDYCYDLNVHIRGIQNYVYEYSFTTLINTLPTMPDHTYYQTILDCMKDDNILEKTFRLSKKDSIKMINCSIQIIKDLCKGEMWDVW